MPPLIPPALRKYYTNEAGRVFHGKSRIDGVDVDTFEPLNAWWSRDSSRIYHLDKYFRKADRASFVALNLIFAKDKDRVFAESNEVAEADAATFTTWSEVPDTHTLVRHFARDKNAVFHKVLTIGKAVVVRGADPATFRPVGYGFGVDAKHVFYENGRC